MSAHLQSESNELGPLASRLGLDGRHAAAARRHAERLESRGQVDAALDAWRVALFVEPTDPRTWRGLARCIRALGSRTDAEVLDQVADRLASKAVRDAS